MEQITEESSSYDTLECNVNKILKKRTQSLRNPCKDKENEWIEDMDAMDANNGSHSQTQKSIKGKKVPKRSASSPSVRIEVRVHRPLTWQVSSSSSSSITIPRKSLKCTDYSNENENFCILNSNGQNEEIKYKNKVNDLNLENYEEKSLNQIRHKIRNRRWKENQRNYYENDESSSEENENPVSEQHRRRKRIVSSAAPGRLRIGQTLTTPEETYHTHGNPREQENCSLVPILKLSLEPSQIQRFSSTGKKTRVENKEKQKKTQKSQSFGFDFSNRECHVSQVLHPVMTWFREPGVHVNTKESEMGANGSTHHTHNNRHSHGGRLKSRSHSSSALYSNKTGNNGSNTTGITAGSTPHMSQGLSNGNSYIYNGYEPASNNSKSLSSSIPADLWDLPPNSKSYSPIRLRNQRHLHSQPKQPPESYIQQQQQQQQQSTIMYQKQNHRPAIVETIISRAKKGGGRKGSSGAMAVEQHNISNRAKLYAVSCPDVAQVTNVIENVNYGFHYDDERVQPTHPDIVDRPEEKSQAQSHQHHYREIHQPHCMKYQGGRRQKSFESSTQDTKCSFPYPAFPFITNDTIFEVLLKRDQLGLGLSVTGGSDSQESYPGLIRVKKVFPMGPAFQSARLRPWDIILKANGVPLTGLTNHEALEVLRTTPTETQLTLSRPPSNIPGFFFSETTTIHSSHPSVNLNQVSTTSTQSYTQPAQVSASSIHLCQNPSECFSCPQESDLSFKSKSLSSLKIPSSSQTQQTQSHLGKTYGEFEVTLEKYAGSLGFTLRQEDTSVLGHYVRALVKDPALTDGRIQPGDRILSVNDVDLIEMSHAEAINFLRQCPGEVKLRLYRDVSPTPLSPLSPTESHKSMKPKPKPLRQEAIDMLNDLAMRKKLSGSSDGNAKSSLPGSAVGRMSGLKGGKSSGCVNDANGPATLPRQRRPGHAGVTPSPEVLSAALDRFAGRSTTPKSSKSQSPESGLGNNTGESGLGSSTSYPSETRSSGSGESTPAGTITQCRANRTKTDRNQGRVNSGYSGETNLGLDSSANSSDISISSEVQQKQHHPKRKTSFRQYTLHLDRISSLEDDSFSTDLNHTDSIVSEPGFGPSSRLSHDQGESSGKFRYGQPAYQSAIVPSSKMKVTKKKNLSLSREDIEKHGIHGLRSLGGNESPTTLSDIDIPSCSTFSSSPPRPRPHHCTAPSIPQNNQLNGTKSTASSSGVNHSSSSSLSSTGGTSTIKGKADSLLKWKGVLFSQDQDENDEEEDNLDSLDGSLVLSHRHRVPGIQQQIRESQESLSSPISSKKLNHRRGGGMKSEAEAEARLPQRQSPDGREFRECDMNLIEIASSKHLFNGEQIFTVQLSRRWCSRLGFSLQGTNGHTFITAVYPDSVAGRDGRLRVGDEVIMVNNETVRDMVTTEVIDLMRKARGMISITLLRKPNSEELETNSSDHQLGLT